MVGAGRHFNRESIKHILEYLVGRFFSVLLVIIFVFKLAVLVKNYRRIPIMEAVDTLKSHPIKDFRLTLEAIFSNQQSEHSTETKQLLLFILEQSKKGKPSLFGKKEYLMEEELVPHYDMQLERLGFDENDMPVIYDFDHKTILYKELHVDKKELLNLTKSFPILQMKEELCHGI